MENMNQLHASERTPETKGQMGHWAPYYDFYMGLVTLGRECALREMTVELAQVEPGDKVLEVGCGTGTLTTTAKVKAGPSGEVHGIDVAPEMIKVSRRKAARAGLDITFQVGRIDNIPFPDNHFDVVLCSFMIFHMPDDTRRRGFVEIQRVLKPNARLLVLDLAPPYQPWQRSLATLLFGRMLQHNLQEILPEMEKAGFKEVEMGQTKHRWVSFVRGRAGKA